MSKETRRAFYTVLGGPKQALKRKTPDLFDVMRGFGGCPFLLLLFVTRFL